MSNTTVRAQALEECKGRQILQRPSPFQDDKVVDSRFRKIRVKGVLNHKILQVIVNRENINFRKCPLYLFRFAILDIESKKKRRLSSGRAQQGAPFLFRD